MAKGKKGIVSTLGRALPCLLSAALFSYFILMRWPLDGDETMRLDEATRILAGDVPLYDTLMVFSFPGFWLFLMPLVSLVPDYCLPFAARIFSLMIFFAALAVFAMVHHRLNRSNYLAAAACSIGLLLTIPEILYKAAECRPDTPAGALLLLGGMLFLLEARTSIRIGGLVLVGLAVALKLEFAVAMLPLALGWLVLLRKGKQKVSWALGLMIPGLVVAGVLLILVGGRIFEILGDIPALAGLAKIGKGSTEGQLGLVTALAIGLIFLLALLELIRLTAMSDERRKIAFAIFTLGTGFFSLYFHQKMGATFLHNRWFPVYFALPPAGAFLARQIGFLLPGKGKVPAWLVAVVCILGIIAVLVPMKGRFTTQFDLQGEVAWWQNLLALEKGDPNPEGEFEGYVDRKPLEVAKFLRFLHHRYGNDFTIYSNDFRSLFGTQVPPRAVVKLSTLMRVHKNLEGSPHGERIRAIFRQRFAPALFIRDGKQLSAGAYLRSWEPDVIVADNTFLRMVLSDHELRKMVADKYQPTVADGSVLIFEKVMPAAAVLPPAAE